MRQFLHNTIYVNELMIYKLLLLSDRIIFITTGFLMQVFKIFKQGRNTWHILSQLVSDTCGVHNVYWWFLLWLQSLDYLKSHFFSAITLEAANHALVHWLVDGHNLDVAVEDELGSCLPGAEYFFLSLLVLDPNIKFLQKWITSFRLYHWTDSSLGVTWRQFSWVTGYFC